MGLFKKRKIGLLPYISEELSSKSPNDPQFKGWEIIKFNIDDCWVKSDGAGVVVAVLDTGCDLDHPDLKPNLLPGKNFVEKNQPPEDRCGHGSHVAGTIAACNNRLGMVGVAPKTKIIPVKVLGDDGFGSMMAIAQGIKYAVDQNVDFITMSLGSTEPDKKIKQAIDYAESRGVVIFCAAGNEGAKENICFPARHENVIAIGAIDEHLNRTSFTCAGPSLDFLAPGKDIVSCIPDNKYALMSGTSMSNPFATGCASLLLSWNKKHKKYKLDNYRDYINIFKQSAIHLKDRAYAGKIEYEGHGIINVGDCMK